MNKEIYEKLIFEISTTEALKNLKIRKLENNKDYFVKFEEIYFIHSQMMQIYRLCFENDLLIYISSLKDKDTEQDKNMTYTQILLS